VNTAPTSTSLRRPQFRDVVRRFVRRLRYGLLIQEILDRLARAGLICYPYFLQLDEPARAPSVDLPPACTVRRLQVEDAAEIERGTEGRYPKAWIIGYLSRATCVGVFCEGRLAGVIWARLDRVNLPMRSEQAVVVLRDSEAYMAEVFVAAPYRGLRLAEALERALQGELIRRGRSRFLSMTLAFNRSARRFNARLGTPDIELRIYLHLWPTRLSGVDLRLWRRAPPIRSAWARRIPPVGTDQLGA
jgi:GNAT superfamily N-acetyltransferase